MFAIAIHGGAGTLSRGETSGDQEKLYLAGLSDALDAGFSLLEQGASSLDAVTAAVVSLEDNPLFNAGRGAVLTRDGVAELDASIMDGRTLVLMILDRKGPAPGAEGEQPMEEGSAAVAEGEAGEGGVVPAGRTLTREGLYRQLQRVAGQLQAMEPHSPIPYLINKAIELDPNNREAADGLRRIREWEEKQRARQSAGTP